jgi:hypothetical protein
MEFFMPALSVKPTLAATIPALGLFLLFQACGGSDSAVAQQAPDPIQGVWEGAVTIRDCTSGNPLATFRGSQVFHAGGTMGDTNNAPTSTRGPGFGTWTRDGDTYTARFRFFTYDGTGAPTGTGRTTRTFTISADGKTTNSTNTAVFEDSAGVVVRTTCGTDVGTRVL